MVIFESSLEDLPPDSDVFESAPFRRYFYIQNLLLMYYMVENIFKIFILRRGKKNYYTTATITTLRRH